jgi:hypothetical protein
MVYENKRRENQARQALLFHIERLLIYYTAKHNKILAFFVKTRLLLFIFVVFRQIAINTNQCLLFLLLFPFNICMSTISFQKKKILHKTGLFFSTFSCKNHYIYTILCMPFHL